MRGLSIAAVLLVACGVSPTPATSPLHGPSGPPTAATRSLGLFIGPPRVGQEVRLRITGAAPGDTVWLGVDDQVGAGPCPAAYGVCLNLPAPTPLGPFTAGADGTVSFAGPIPSSLLVAGRELCVQGLVDSSASPADVTVVHCADVYAVGSYDGVCPPAPYACPTGTCDQGMCVLEDHARGVVRSLASDGTALFSISDGYMGEDQARRDRDTGTPVIPGNSGKAILRETHLPTATVRVLHRQRLAYSLYSTPVQVAPSVLVWESFVQTWRVLVTNRTTGDTVNPTLGQLRDPRAPFLTREGAWLDAYQGTLGLLSPNGQTTSPPNPSGASRIVGTSPAGNLYALDSSRVNLIEVDRTSLAQVGTWSLPVGYDLRRLITHQGNLYYRANDLTHGAQLFRAPVGGSTATPLTQVWEVAGPALHDDRIWFLSVLGYVSPRQSGPTELSVFDPATAVTTVVARIDGISEDPYSGWANDLTVADDQVIVTFRDAVYAYPADAAP